MKYLIIILFVMYGCNEKKQSNSNDQEVVTSSESETEQETEDVDESNHVDIETGDNYDLEPMITINGIEFKKTKHSHLTDGHKLEYLEYGRDYNDNCNIYKSKRGIKVVCDKTPCSKLETKYLQSFYSSVFIATRKDKRISLIRRKRIFKRQRLLEKCQYRNNTVKVVRWDGN